MAMVFMDHIEKAKEVFAENKIAYNFILKAEQTYKEGDYNLAVQSLNYACRVLLEQGKSKSEPGINNLYSARSILMAEKPKKN
ncbi:MAG: hypothetical protein J5525_13040 [Lachnospiraceae bacterium]|nr:hypothetical protein [Lachnospiraceae bacterium]